MTSQTILKVLTGAGIGSRRRMADAVKQGRVAVNGKLVEDFRHPVNMETDVVKIDGKRINFAQEPPVYLMLNKPNGITATTNDERGNRTVIDILPSRYKTLRLYPVGRLDKDSKGLMLLTNDGDLTYHVTHPRFELEKEYYIHIEGNLSPVEKQQMERGLALVDGMTYPVKIKELSSCLPFNYSITIHEGRKRQVRRMLATLGYPVLELKRVRMGRLTLGNLKEGHMRELSSKEISELKNMTKYR